MLKELKYLFYILIFFLFIILNIKFYFSDTNKKNSYRSFKEIDEKIITYSQKLILLKNNTDNVVKYVEKFTDKNKKNFNFWKLIINNGE
jgi:hypothetical protein|tara:strand:- start:610 stop:876 length:267 start_codon:yes stop_codon:yes gene_type:complete